MNECMSPEIGKLAKALSCAQEIIENVPKDKAGYNYKYATLASCLDVIKKPFALNGLAISQAISATESGELALITLLLHESGQWIKSIFPLKSEGTKSTNEMQALGSGISYARRYALSAITGLAQEDDDGATSKMNYNKPTVTSSTASNDSHKLMELCRDAMINAAEFAKFHHIDSKNPATVKNAIENFSALRYQFDNREIEDEITLTNDQICELDSDYAED